MNRVEAPTGQPDSVLKVEKKRRGWEIQEGLPDVTVISVAEMPKLLAEREEFAKRREEARAQRRSQGNQRYTRHNFQEDRLFDAY